MNLYILNVLELGVGIMLLKNWFYVVNGKEFVDITCIL